MPGTEGVANYLGVLPQVVADGLVLGFVYALIAIGYTLVYGVLEFINFSHSEVFMVGAFVAAEVMIFGRPLLTNPLGAALILLIAIVLAMLTSGLLGMSIERVAYRPLRNAPRLVPLISAIGVSFFLQDAVRIVEGLVNNAFYRTAPPMFETPVRFGIFTVQSKALIVIGISVAMMIGLTRFVKQSKLGQAIRAVAQDQATAKLMGINADRVISYTFLIGTALGGVAGALYTLQYALVHPFIGFILGLKAFTAAVFGGIGNVPGAMLGGVLLGVIESVGAAYLGPLTGGRFGAEYKDVLAFVILVGVLIFKPSGLLGEVVGEKV